MYDPSPAKAVCGATVLGQRGAWLTGDGETAEAPFLLESAGLADGGLLGDDDRVGDEAVLVPLNLAHHVGLAVGRAVVVDNTQTALQSHVDGHLMLGDRVHGRGQEGRLQGDALGDGRVEVDLGGGEADVARQDQEVVVRQATVLLGVHEVVNAEPITVRVLRQVLDGVLEVQRGSHGGGVGEM